MVSSGYLASALVMGSVLVALAVGLMRGRNWKRYPLEREERDSVAVLRGVASNPTVWALGFVLFSLVAGAGAVLFVSGASVPASVRRGAWLAVVASAVVLGGGYVLWGTYQSSRYRGLNGAQATLAALWVGGALFVLAVIFTLVTA